MEEKFYNKNIRKKESKKTASSNKSSKKVTSSKKSSKKIAGKTGLEAYDPEKNIIEKIKDIPKRYFLVIGIILVVLISTYSTYAFFKNNPELAEDWLGISTDSSIDREDVKKETTNLDEEKSSFNKPLEENQKDKNSQQKEINKKETQEKTGPEFKPADYSTMKQNLLDSPFIRELPSKGRIVLGFYNFHTGYREWEKHYIIEKNSVKEGETKDRDMKIFLHSKYVDDFKEKGMCDVVGDARAKGDLGLETEKSKTSLMWKYRGMMEYRDCFGL